MTDELDVLESQEVPKVLPPESGAPFNMVEDVIYRRRSARFYKKKQVPEYLIRRILETGRFAPSAGNGQTWKFIVVRSQKMIEDMTADVVRLCQTAMSILDYQKPGKEKWEWLMKLMQRFRNNDFHPIPAGAMKLIAEGKLGVWHGASTVIILLADKRSPGSPMLDVGIAGQNMVLTAHSFGLATCWVSFVKPLRYFPKWNKQLGIRYPYELATSIALGYPRGNPDGYVVRETQAIDWYDENGSFKVVY